MWLLSLHIAVVIADLMKNLEPAHVRDYIKTADDADPSQSVVTATQAANNWQRDVAAPGVALVSTMQELSAWGTAMAWTIIGCFAASLGWLPTALAHHDFGMLTFIIVLTGFPLSVAYSPAVGSSSCDDLLDQLTEISFLGDRDHRERCMQFRWSLTNLNRSQGLGFLMSVTALC